MAYETELKGWQRAWIEHGPVKNTPRPVYHETMAAPEVRSIVGKLESMSLGGRGYLEARIKSTRGLENTYKPIKPNQVRRPNEEKPRNRETQELPRIPGNQESQGLGRPPASRETQTSARRPTQSVEIPQSRLKHFADSDSDNDDDNDGLEIEKLGFVMSKGDEAYENQDWEKAEGYFTAAINFSKTVRGAAGHPELVFDEGDTHLHLAWCQYNQNKFKEALQTINLLSGVMSIQDEFNLSVGVGYISAMTYNKLGDFKLARRRCKKVIKLAREAGDDSLLSESIKLMVDILEKIEGPDDIELAFYKSILPSDPQAGEDVVGGNTKSPVDAAGEYIQSPVEVHVADDIMSAKDIAEVTPWTDAEETTKSPTSSDSSFQYTKKDMVLLAGWKLTIGSDGKSISGSDTSLDKAIWHAVQNKDMALAKALFKDPLLVERQCSIYTTRKLPTLHQAVRHKGSTEMVRFLLDKGAKLFSASSSGNSVLDIAITDGKKEMIQFLLFDCRFPVESFVDGLGGSHLHRALGSDPFHWKIELLISAGADVNRRDFRGQTPLIRAADCPYHGSAKYETEPPFKVLLDGGADVNAVDDDGNTALHVYVAQNNERHDIRTLLAYGADLRIRNKAGQRPIDMSRYHGEGIMALLRP